MSTIFSRVQGPVTHQSLDSQIREGGKTHKYERSAFAARKGDDGPVLSKVNNPKRTLACQSHGQQLKQTQTIQSGEHGREEEELILYPVDEAVEDESGAEEAEGEGQRMGRTNATSRPRSFIPNLDGSTTSTPWRRPRTDMTPYPSSYLSLGDSRRT